MKMLVRSVSKPGARFTSKLTPAGDGKFRVLPASDEKTEIIFEPKASGRPRVQITTTDEDGEVEKKTFEPVESWTPTAGDLAGFAGTYASRELDTTWRLVVEKGQLFVRHRGIPEQALTPTIKDQFAQDGMTLAFRRSGAKAAGFTLEVGRVRGVVFARAAD